MIKKCSTSKCINVNFRKVIGNFLLIILNDLAALVQSIQELRNRPDADCVYAQKPWLTSGYPKIEKATESHHIRTLADENYLSRSKINVQTSPDFTLNKHGEKALGFWNKVYLLQSKRKILNNICSLAKGLSSGSPHKKIISIMSSRAKNLPSRQFPIQ